jgi:pyruvate dehydrogenase E2 component (dihydrolipoamide acetyltransferase)
LTAIKEVVVPDIGSVAEVGVIEVNVKPGDKIAENDTLITLESEKASMDIPSPFTGIVKEVAVKVGSKVTQGSLVLRLEVADEKSTPVPPAQQQPAETMPKTAAAAASAVQPVVVPDIGNVAEVGVIEVNVKVGDTVAENDTLVTLESEKASMDIPSPFAGVVKEVAVKVGSKVKQGSVLVQLATASAAPKPDKSAKPEKTAQPEKADTSEKPKAEKQKPVAAAAPAPKLAETPAAAGFIYAGPGVRRVAREFGVDLNRVRGTGRKGRIVTEDVQAYVKAELVKTQSGSNTVATGSGLPTMPPIDFSQFGDTETVSLYGIIVTD